MARTIFCTTCYCLVKYVRKKTLVFSTFYPVRITKKRQNSDLQVKVPLTITTAQCFLALGVRALMTRTSGRFRGFARGLCKLADSFTPKVFPCLSVLVLKSRSFPLSTAMDSVLLTARVRGGAGQM